MTLAMLAAWLLDRTATATEDSADAQITADLGHAMALVALAQYSYDPENWSAR